MKQILLFLVLAGWLPRPAAAQTAEQRRMPAEIEPIEAPFAMPAMQRPQIPNYRTTIAAGGARQGRLSTAAIQRTIDRTAQRGGGQVTVPAGRWLTGRITLRSNIELHLEKGAELCFSGAVQDYQPAVFTRNEGVEMLSLGACIYADGAENIAITGEGTLVGPGRGCEIDTLEKNDSYLDTYVTADIPVAERLYDGRQGRRIFRPVLIGLMNCRNVLIEGVSLRQTIFWNIVPEYCNGVIIRGVDIDSHGTPRGDAVDIESTRNVLIEYCTVNTTDDAYTMKAGRGRDALRVNRPTENVVIRHCRAIHSAGGLAVGTEIGGCVRNIWVQDCDFDEVQHGIYLKTNRLRGGGGSGITVEDVRIRNAKHVLYCDMLGSQKWVGAYAVRYPDAATLERVADLTPEFRDIALSRIEATGCTWFIRAMGLPERPLRNLSLEGMRVECERFADLQDIDGLSLRDCEVRCREVGSALRAVENSRFINVTIQATER